MDGITWEQFLCDIKIIHDISQHLNDNWKIETDVSWKFIGIFFLLLLNLYVFMIGVIQIEKQIF